MMKYETFNNKKIKGVPNLKGKWFGAMLIARAAKVKAVAEQTAKDAIDAASSEYLGVDARVVDEEYVQIYGVAGKVVKELGDTVLLKMTENQHLTKCAKMLWRSQVI